METNAAITSGPKTSELQSLRYESAPTKPDSEPTDQNLVDFQENDPENPLNWPKWRKWATVLSVATMFMLVNFGTITIVPAAPEVLAEFHVSNKLYTTLLVSIWELGEGVGPFLVGPLSELFGRMPVYHAGNILTILCCVAAALSTSMSMLVAFRFLSGFVITSLTLGPAIVGDLFKKEERGSAMALAICLPLVGPFAAPIVGSYTAEAKGWRWTIWIVVIAIGVATLVSFSLFRETYQVIILKRKAQRLQKVTGNNLLRSKHQEKVDKSSLWQSVTRPARMLLLSPIVLIVSFYTALTYGISYLILTTLTEIMQDVYNFSQGAVGLTFLGRAVGNVIGMAVYALVSDRYVKYRKKIDGVMKPEHRLPLMLLGAFILPLGLILYGWTADKQAHWIAPLIGTAIVGFSMLLTILPTENYLVDLYDIHGASAVAAGVVLRAIFGALLPLIGPPLYDNLEYGWGNSLLAFIAIGFLPLLIILTRYGEQIRNSHNFRQEF